MKLNSSEKIQKQVVAFCRFSKKVGYNKRTNHHPILQQHYQRMFDEQLFPKSKAAKHMKMEKDIQFLKEINSYRGVRHASFLPVRGQRTKRNAKTNTKKYKKKL